jgi:hypothetical protein
VLRLLRLIINDLSGTQAAGNECRTSSWCSCSTTIACVLFHVVYLTIKLFWLLFFLVWSGCCSLGMRRPELVFHQEKVMFHEKGKTMWDLLDLARNLACPANPEAASIFRASFDKNVKTESVSGAWNLFLYFSLLLPHLAGHAAAAREKTKPR